MEIMRLLTRKLKSQSLEAEEQEQVEEVEEEEEEVGSDGRRTFPEQRRNNDTMQATEFDSGTASDEDVTEFEEAPPCLRGIEAKLNCQVAQMAAQTQMDRTMTMDPGCFSSQPNATSYSSSVISPQNVVSSVMMMPHAASKDSGISSSSSSGQAAAAVALVSGRLSAVSSDLEWCSLDFDPPPSSSSCSSEMDEQHSSEEELVSIYRHNEQKRKHSQMSPNDDNQCTSGEEEEEDEEERFHRNCDHHHRPLSSSNHRCLHGNCLRGNVGIPISAFGQTTAASDFASPRKRHRQTMSIVNSTTAIQQQQQRPSLDLYKMQKTSITRKYHNGCTNIASTNCRPRVVKIRTITGSSRPAKSAYNPSVFSFRSISWASSRLKEEPFRAF